MRRALIVVAKQPAPGHTKTRLSPPFDASQASALYECFLRDTLEIVRTAQAMLDFQPIITYLPEGAEPYFHKLAPDFRLLLQQGRDLSERLHNATARCLTEEGCQQAVIMDSDSPTLPVDCLIKAFKELDNADVSLGPCADGGYYLIGLKAPAPRLFLDVTMSTPHVVADTLACAAQEGLQVAMLPTSYDIDYVDDLRRLVAELRTLPTEIAPHTRGFLAKTPSVHEVL